MEISATPDCAGVATTPTSAKRAPAAGALAAVAWGAVPTGLGGPSARAKSAGAADGLVLAIGLTATDGVVELVSFSVQKLSDSPSADHTARVRIRTSHFPRIADYHSAPAAGQLATRPPP